MYPQISDGLNNSLNHWGFFHKEVSIKASTFSTQNHRMAWVKHSKNCYNCCILRTYTYSLKNVLIALNGIMRKKLKLNS